MNILIIISTVLLSILLICLIFILSHIRKLSETLITLTNQIQSTPTADERYDKSQLTSYELERLEREEEFDNRINRLKEELATQQQVIRKGVTADELHPLVHNLPHDTVQNKYDVLPDVEVAE